MDPTQNVSTQRIAFPRARGDHPGRRRSRSVIKDYRTMAASRRTILRTTRRISRISINGRIPPSAQLPPQSYSQRPREAGRDQRLERFKHRSFCQRSSSQVFPPLSKDAEDAESCTKSRRVSAVVLALAGALSTILTKELIFSDTKQPQ